METMDLDQMNLAQLSKMCHEQLGATRPPPTGWAAPKAERDGTLDMAQEMRDALRAGKAPQEWLDYAKRNEGRGSFEKGMFVVI